LLESVFLPFMISASKIHFLDRHRCFVAAEAV